MKLNKVQKEVKEELLKTLPPSTQNNSRKYWGRKIDKWYETEMPHIGRELEEQFGLAIDYKNTDAGVDRPHLKEVFTSKGGDIF